VHAYLSIDQRSWRMEQGFHRVAVGRGFPIVFFFFFRYSLVEAM
jgi:hypothetical protein